ncbi:hypothetical protein BHM03_00050308 [Ensete ventricosum]|nr:hypothetical protein BHM03_00050308 [Ensete ventricosum]
MAYWPSTSIGLPLVAKPQGPTAHGATARGSPTARAVANRGSACARRRRQLARCHPKAAAPTAGSAAHTDDVQRRHLRRAATTAATQMQQGEG